MGQSLVKNYVHIVFSTKHRDFLIYPPYEEDLYFYIAGICRNFQCPPVSIGGYRDHVHILCRLSKNISLMKLVGKIKSNSSGWMKSRSSELKNFFWQKGYGAFSVDPAEVNGVTDYIANQNEHHCQLTFKEEFIGFLDRYEIAYDERYVWD